LSGNQGVCVMEDVFLVILILGTLFAALLGVQVFKKAQNPVKKAQKKAELSIFDNLTEYREVEKSTIGDILKQKDNQIKSLNARIKLLEPIDEEDQPKQQVSFEEITQLVNNSYPKYAPLLPLMKKQIMEMTKGMSLDEIITYVKNLTGNQQPQGGINQPQSLGYDPNFA